MHEVLVNRLGGLSLPRKSMVRLTDRPDMTLDVYRGRKTTIQQQQQILAIFGCPPAGHQTWPAGGRGSQAASGRYSKLKFLRCPVHFHIRPHILHTSFKYRPISGQESSGNRPVYVASEEKFLGPDIRPMSVYTLENNPPMSDWLEPLWTRYVTDIGRAV